MLLTIEKVMILKSVDIFSATPEEDLIEVASIVEEISVKKGEEFITKGDIGTSMYIIIEGQVRVHDGDRELAKLGRRTVVGDMSALDPEPRNASITAIEDTELFRLDGGPLYDLMAEHIEVVRGITRVLCQRLRNANSEIARLKNEKGKGQKGRNHNLGEQIG
ncbi:MAG: cyclic nucleotide-binding domain-containing protein [Desulfobacteraceae bacterium]|nr:cyclic nucleotide-binding domain-containing protein [Desulfobacteraceae bacterium]